MESVDSYLSEILAAITPLQPEDIPLTEAQGAVLAADAVTSWPVPGFDNSAMDGYAVRAADVAGASAENPVALPVDAEIAAGDTAAYTLAPGRSIKIMTGALLPAGADAVIPVEWTDDGRQTVRISRSASAGNAVRREGDDAKPGDLLLPAGTRLGAAQIGVLAAAGHGTVLARGRPRGPGISTGDEVAGEAGCEATRHPRLRDEADEVLAAIEQAAATADLLMTSGGVSMGGEHDVVKAALTKLGTVMFRKVAMQPGMPQGFGLIGDEPQTPIFTLPGNPVSAFVSFRLFVEPAVRALQGLAAQPDAPGRARLAAPVTSPGGKRSVLRANLYRQGGSVTPLTGQNSHQIASLARADSLIIIPEAVTSLPAGQTVDVLELP